MSDAIIYNVERYAFLKAKDEVFIIITFTTVTTDIKLKEILNKDHQFPNVGGKAALYNIMNRKISNR
ncbi:hypothetical protein VNO80_04767 [Phaseolus coccineus]|uniref:Uncharacterized protein n=1 Tax=Phaseolus coccineus TaxID=3886 RepID=A0AAN9RJX9_PHACN